MGERSRTVQHIFAYVFWKERHTHSNFYDSSATLCMTSSEATSLFLFIPVQCIYAIGASCVMKVDVSGFEELGFIAAPVPMRLSF